MKRVMEGFTKYQMPIVPAALAVEHRPRYCRPRSLGAGPALIKETNTKSHFTAMTNQQINTRLQDILANVGISLSALTDQASFSKDLGLDSLDITDLLLQVEISFGIRIPDEDWWQLQTLGQLKAYLIGEAITIEPV